MWQMLPSVSVAHLHWRSQEEARLIVLYLSLLILKKKKTKLLFPHLIEFKVQKNCNKYIYFS